MAFKWCVFFKFFPFFLFFFLFFIKPHPLLRAAVTLMDVRSIFKADCTWRVCRASACCDKDIKK